MNHVEQEIYRAASDPEFQQQQIERAFKTIEMMFSPIREPAIQPKEKKTNKKR